MKNPVELKHCETLWYVKFLYDLLSDETKTWEGKVKLINFGIWLRHMKIGLRGFPSALKLLKSRQATQAVRYKLLEFSWLLFCVTNVLLGDYSEVYIWTGQQHVSGSSTFLIFFFWLVLLRIVHVFCKTSFKLYKTMLIYCLTVYFSQYLYLSIWIRSNEARRGN